MTALRAALPPTGCLAHGEVHVWRAALEAPADAMRELPLSEEEQERAARFRHAGDRARFTLGRGMLRELLAGYLGEDPRAFRFLAGPHGKPRLAACMARGLEFNLAHSGDFVLVAVSDAPVGVDVECLDRSIDASGLATRFLAPSEVAQLRSAEWLPHHFLRLWVLKEALVKGLGLGITGMALRDFAVAPGDDGGIGIQPLTDDARALLAGWSLAELPVPGEYAAAIACGRPAVTRMLEWPGDFRRHRPGPGA